MAKELGTFEIVIRGTESGPTTSFVVYQTKDSTNPELCDRPAPLEDAIPDFNKTLHNTGAVGEVWKDVVEVVKTIEGIS